MRQDIILFYISKTLSNIKNAIIFLCISCVLSSCSTPFKIHYNYKQTAPAAIKKKIVVALVLGSGGARSMAHLGVIEVLEKNKIPIDLIIGTSGGSIIGALYADNPNAETLKEKLFNCTKNDLIDFSPLSAFDGAHSTHSSIIDGSKGEKFLLQHLRAKNFDQLKIPFVAIATNVTTGKTAALNSGPIAPAVRASYSIPGLFAPVELYGMTLVDGGVTAPLGIEVAKKYHPHIIIAVDINLPTEQTKVTNMLDLTYKSLNITYNTLNDLLCKEADVLIRPELGNAGLFEDHKRDVLYNAGVTAAQQALPKIQKLINQYK